MTIFDGGWQSVTTRADSMLCAIISVLLVKVFSRKISWYVRKFVGAINGQSKFKTETFQSGYVFA